MSVLGLTHRRLGLWITKTEIAFALVEQGGNVVLRGRVPRTERGREALLDCLPPNLEIVLSESDSIIDLVFDNPYRYVRPELVRSIRRAAGINNAPHEVSAALLTCLARDNDRIGGGAPGTTRPLFPPSILGDRHGNR